MSDRFFTFMVVPERGNRVRRFTIPSIYLRAGAVLLAAFALIGIFVFYDYLHVMSQVAENKRLRRENHELQRDVQKAKNQLEQVDQSMARLKSFAQKLRVLGNLDQPGAMKYMQAPDAASSGGGSAVFDMQQEDSGNLGDMGEETQEAPKPNKSKKGKKGAPAAEAPEAYVPPTPLPNDVEGTAPWNGGSLLASGKYDLEATTLLGQVDEINAAALELGRIALEEERHFASLYEHFQDRAVLLRSTPSILPAQGFISSPFGWRSNPFVGVRTFHAGLDIANAPGTPIIAPADGTVTFVGMQGGFGKVLRIDHGYNIVTKYGHNSAIHVKKGDRVKRGQRIAAIGSSGRSTGPHLHYQVEVAGRPVNPKSFILEADF